MADGSGCIASARVGSRHSFNKNPEKILRVFYCPDASALAVVGTIAEFILQFRCGWVRFQPSHSKPWLMGCSFLVINLNFGKMDVGACSLWA
jgi:hypothetical protein